MGIIILSTRFHLLVECVGVFRIAVMFYVPLVGFIPLRLLLGFSLHRHYTLIVVLFQAVYVWIFPFMVHSQCGIVYCVYYFINTKPLPTDFHWSMGRGGISHIASCGVWGMSVCRHCGFICLHYYYTRWWGKIQWKNMF